MPQYETRAFPFVACLTAAIFAFPNSNGQTTALLDQLPPVVVTANRETSEIENQRLNFPIPLVAADADELKN